MQGRNTNIIKFIDSLKAFISKSETEDRKVNIKNVEFWESFLVAGDDDEALPELA